MICGKFDKKVLTKQAEYGIILRVSLVSVNFKFRKD